MRLTFNSGLVEPVSKLVALFCGSIYCFVALLQLSVSSFAHRHLFQDKRRIKKTLVCIGVDC